MYLRKVHIENIRSIAELDWEIPEGREAGWHVVIGDNGSGKTSLLRAIALALAGPYEAGALRQDWRTWLRRDEARGAVELELIGDRRFDGLTFRADWQRETVNVTPSSSGEKTVDGGRLRVDEKSLAELDRAEHFLNESRPFSIRFDFKREKEADNSTIEVTAGSREVRPETLVWGGNETGWFSASFGPFRRFTGSDEESRKILSTNFKLAPHLTVFGENYVLTECLDWLKGLKFRQLEGLLEGNWLDQITSFINQEGLLPHQARLEEVSSQGIFFIDGNGHRLLIEDFSDGYRSVFSLALELIRQFVFAYDPHNLSARNKVFTTDGSKVISPGVVLIDEVDAHLHPTWQRSIGQWFRKHFPNIQFIVTTHSPLVCQAAEHGTVFRLPAPGSGEKAEMVTGIALNRLLYGNVLDAYGTELFGEEVGRSETGQRLLQQLAELNVKQVNQGLSKTEKKKQQELRATFPTSSAISNGQGKRRK